MKRNTVIWFWLSIGSLIAVESAAFGGLINAAIAALGGFAAGSSIALAAIQLWYEREMSK